MWVGGWDAGLAYYDRAADRFVSFRHGSLGDAPSWDVTADDAPALADTGVAGLAVVRGLMESDDPTRYVQRLLTGFGEGRR